jgi:hypothetical protein
VLVNCAYSQVQGDALHDRTSEYNISEIFTAVADAFSPQGDPYIKVDQGYARLPGAGYEALHPELEGLNPEDYPDLHKMRILADVAPYSREYQKWSSIVRYQAKDNPDLLTEYERISEQVRKTKESTMQVAQRHFNAPVDTVEGTVKKASAQGVELAEYPGRTFRFSAVSTSMADLTAEMLGMLKRPGPFPAAHTTHSRARGRDRHSSLAGSQPVSGLRPGPHVQKSTPSAGNGSRPATGLPGRRFLMLG